MPSIDESLNSSNVSVLTLSGILKPQSELEAETHWGRDKECVRERGRATENHSHRGEGFKRTERENLHSLIHLL